MTDKHVHLWEIDDDWIQDEYNLHRQKHYISYRCEDRFCTMRKIVLKETTTFEYIIDGSSDFEDW